LGGFINLEYIIPFYIDFWNCQHLFATPAHQNHKTRLTGIEKEYKRYKMNLFLAYLAKSATDDNNRIKESIIYPIQNRTIARLPP